MNWLQKLAQTFKSAYRGYKKPYTGPPRYFGPARLVNFMGRPALIGNTMSIRNKVDLAGLGFRWDGNIKIDATELGDAPDNVINGAWIGSRALTQPEIDILAQNGIDVSMSSKTFQPFRAGQQAAVPATPAAPTVPAVAEPTESQGAQSDEANVEMVMKLRDASSYADTEAVMQDQIKKLIQLMTNPHLTDEQKKLKAQFLKFMESAHNYSFFNTILIFMQNRNATMVGGAKNLWEAKGRSVKPGEQPIWVLAPVFWKPRLSNEDYKKMLQDLSAKGMSLDQARKSIEEWRERNKRLSKFKDVPVFDISQTSPIPGWRDPQTGEPPFEMEAFHESYRLRANTETEYTATLWKAVVAAAAKDGIKVEQSNTGAAGGWSSGGNIQIDEKSAGERRLATMFHEYAHEILHSSAEGREKRMKEKTPRKIVEMEAEATAFLLAQAFDLQGDPEWAARYIVLWEATSQDVMDRQKEIHKAYQHIMKAVKGQLDSMLPKKPAQQGQPTPTPAPASASGLGTDMPDVAAKAINVIIKVAKILETEEWIQ